MTSANIAGDILSIIDENKQSLKDDVYVRITNALMDIHNEKKSNGFYEAWFIVPKFIPARGSVVHLETTVRKHIIRLDEDIAESYREDINDVGFVHMCTRILPSVERHYPVYDTEIEYDNGEDDDSNDGTELNSILCEVNAITCIRLEKL